MDCLTEKRFKEEACRLEKKKKRSVLTAMQGIGSPVSQWINRASHCFLGSARGF